MAHEGEASQGADAKTSGNVQKHPGGRTSDYRQQYCHQLQEFMRAGFSLTAFAGHIGVAPSTINVWMGAHPEFSEAVSRAKAATHIGRALPGRHPTGELRRPRVVQF
jgi:hypothetical protein